MNSKSILLAAGTALLVITVVLSAFLNAIHAEALRPELYDADSRKAVAAMQGVDPVRDAAVVEAYIGMNAEEQHRFAETVVSFMRGKSETLPEQLNEKEQIHFRDVRQLIQLAGRVASILLGLAVLLTIFGTWLMQHPDVRARWAVVGFVLGIVLLGLAIAWTLTHFETAFYEMHLRVFPNDLWLMDPRTDICIRMMPLELFEMAAMHCLTRTVVQTCLITVLLSILNIFLRRMIRKWVNKPIHG